MVVTEIQKQRAIATHSDQAELFATRYEVIRQDPYQNCFVYSRKRLNEWLDKFLTARGDGLQMLDVGCGTGYHMARYRERGFALTGVDGSAEMLQQAREINPTMAFHQGDVDKLPLPDNTFDLILCIEVLRYLPDIVPCLREMARVLKPGGMALVTAAPMWQANAYPLVNRLATAFKVQGMTALRQYFHTTGELQRACAAAGLSGVEVHGVYGGPMIWGARLFPAAMPALLKAWEPLDAATSDAPVFKHLSNMFLVCARKPN
jgi:ubiquinone/menaquinone biosynthesis C-methylase UbiE